MRISSTAYNGRGCGYFWNNPIEKGKSEDESLIWGL